ncbi:MAG TPA: hypothetical protein V6D10_24610 [Trichocoleus sp.]|jgi:hypothetical protein
MAIGSHADKPEIEGKLPPEVEAQRDLLANPAIDPRELLPEENDPMLAKPPIEPPHPAEGK